MNAGKPIIVPENTLFTEDNSRITYKQEQTLQKKNTFIQHNLIQKLYEMRVYVCKECEGPH